MRWLLFFIGALNGLAQTVSTNPSTIAAKLTVGASSTTNLSVTGAGPVTLTTTTESGGNWLSANAPSIPLPFTATVTFDTSGLPDGTYLGSVNITASTTAVAQVPVIVRIGNSGPELDADGLVSAANYQGGAVSPGEIMVLFGSAIGPQIPYSAHVWNGVVQTRLAGARVWFDKTPAPVVYAYPHQLAVVVPYDVAGKNTVRVQVENLVARTPAFTLPVQAARPAFFTSDSSGKGQLAALNQDNSVNSAANPAAPGSIVVLYATGAGRLSPAVPDGTLVSSTPYPAPIVPIQLMIGGKTAEILYVGAAPTLVAGLLQINARIPTDLSAGSVSVSLTIGTTVSNQTGTISLR